MKTSVFRMSNFTLQDVVDYFFVYQPTMPNPVRLLSPASIGQQKRRHENSLLLFPNSLPMSRPHASSHQAQTSWSAELPVPVPCTHFWLGTLAYLAHTNKHFKIRVISNNCNNLLIITKLSKSENAADFSPQIVDQNMKQVGWQES